MEKILTDNFFHIGTEAAAFDDEGIMWLSSCDFNGLYQYDVQNNQMLLEHRFENTNLNRAELHGKMVIRKDEIFLFPHHDDRIRIYNKRTKVEQIIVMPVRPKRGYTEIVIGDRGWIFSLDHKDQIWYFDISAKLFRQDKELSALFSDITLWDQVSFYSYTSVGKDILALDKTNKMLYIVDSVTYEMEHVDLKYIEEEIFRIRYYQNKYWILLENSHCIYTYEKGSGNFEKYLAADHSYLAGASLYPYTDIVEFNDEFFLLNYYGKNIMRVLIDKKEIVPFKESGAVYGLLNHGVFYAGAMIEKWVLYFIPQRGGTLFVYDSNKNLREVEFGIHLSNDPDILKIIDMMIQENVTEENGGYFNLDSFIKRVPYCKKENKSIRYTGKEIFEILKKS